MSRKQSLLQLQKSLIAQSRALRRKLSENLDLSQTHDEGAVDELEVAADGSQHEINSQLAALESRELSQIEHAIQRIRKGRYGICEKCEGKIPLARLKALPFTQLCIKCQRRMEEMRRIRGHGSENWESVYDLEGATSDRELTLGDIDIEVKD
jgi:DnaK suppressor protein